MRKVTGTRKKRQEAKKECFFCKEEKNDYFHEEGVLLRFVTETGKIY